jgi:hypothetical protein
MQADAALLSSLYPTNKNLSECYLWMRGCESTRRMRHLFGRIVGVMEMRRRRCVLRRYTSTVLGLACIPSSHFGAMSRPP